MSTVSGASGFAAAGSPANRAGAMPAGLPLPPGSWLGVLGGGQLGRMFCAAAQAMGYRVCVLDPDEASPAGAVADAHIRAPWADAAALDALAARCAAITTEFENVPAASLERLAASRVVSPAGACVALAQDRMREKEFAQRCGLAVAPYAEIHREHDLDSADAALFPGILKAARLGYDGKGQARVADRAQAREAFARLGGVPCVLEQQMALAMEVSAVVARGFDGASKVFPIAENLHHQGILARSIVPARITPAQATAAGEAAQRIAQAMDYVGVLCVEFFVLRDGRLLVNEMAPRPHNSGHWSIDACQSSQFEQQARILAGMPLGSVRQLAPAVMLNLMGDLWLPQAPDWARVLAHPEAKLHLYGKTEARPARKMGHLTVVGESPAQTLAVATRIADELGIPGLGASAA